MANLGQFNPDEFKRSAYQLIPDGTYTAIVVDSGWVQTKSGRAIKLTYQLLDGDAKGMQMSQWLNLESSNATAVRIANEDLAELCRATGQTQPRDSSDLHNIPVTVQIVTVVRKDTGEDSNKIKKITKKEGADNLRAIGTQQASGRPWAR